MKSKKAQSSERICTALLMALAAYASLIGYSKSASAKDQSDPRPAELIDTPAGIIVDAKSYREELPAIREAVRSGGEFKCYDQKEYVKLAHTSVDYRWLWYYSLRLENIIDLKDLEIAKMAEQSAIYKVTISESKDSIKYMSDIFDKEHSARLSRESSDAFWGTVKNIGLGVEAALIVGLGTALLILR